jgi:hypothetical protein
MKKTVLVVVSLAFLIGACQGLPIPTLPVGPTVDQAATADSLFKTAVAETLTAQPTVTASAVVEGISETATLPVETPVVPPTETPTPLEPDTPTPQPGQNLTTTPATATEGPTLPPGATVTLAPGQVTASPTLGIRLWGTLPPAVPSSPITLVNKANTEAYISLQVTMPDGTYSILEYPVEGRFKIQAPVGSYLYVAWVGGRKMVGEFRLRSDDELTITLFRDRITVE